MSLHQRPRYAGPAAGAGWAGPWRLRPQHGSLGPMARPPAGGAILTRKWPTLFGVDDLPYGTSDSILGDQIIAMSLVIDYNTTFSVKFFADLYT